MKTKIAVFLARGLSVRDRHGFHAPGTNHASFHSDPTGRTLLVVSRGDEFDFVHGKPDDLIVHAFPAKAALSLAWFFLWRWWVCGTWCGLRTRLWGWGVGVLLNAHGNQAQARERAARDRSRAEAG